MPKTLNKHDKQELSVATLYLPETDMPVLQALVLLSGRGRGSEYRLIVFQFAVISSDYKNDRIGLVMDMFFS
jgi:hypothetical protein